MSEWLDTFWAVYSNLVLTIGIDALLALSIWLTLSCGLLAMANAAFMGLGAYTASLLTMNAGAPFPVAVLGGIALPTLVALLVGLPTLRLSGVYLAMATLGFGEVVRISLLNADSLTGGALGLSGIPQLTQWWHVLLAVAVVLLVLWRMRRSRIGRAFVLAVLTAVLGLGAMVFSGFPGLAQLGVFSAVGLASAALGTWFLLPRLVVAANLAPASADVPGWLARAEGWRRGRWWGGGTRC